MSLRDQVLAQAMLLAGELTERQQMVLGALCTATTASLNARLREGLTAEDCKADFIAAASLLALAAMAGIAEDVPVEQITVGDFTVRKSRRLWLLWPIPTPPWSGRWLPPSRTP